MQPAELRAEFPVLARLSYLNAGTDGPVPARAERAAAERARREVEQGRSGTAHRESLVGMREQIRRLLADLLGCADGEVAITNSTTDGVNTVLSALAFGPGDEVLTTDEEHPGLLAPLAALARRTGASIRVAPFETVAEEVGPETRLVACSHVSWVTGRVVDAAALTDADALVLLDGAQGLGAVPARVDELGCDFYAAAGQKWLCGPDGSGCLYVRGDRAADIPSPWPGFESLADPARPLDLELRDDARRFDRGSTSGPMAAWWLAALELLEGVGWAAVHDRGVELTDRLAAALADRGLELSPRGRSTLISWRDPDPPGTVKRLADEGMVVRDIPGWGLIRASVGAWSSEEELDRLVALAA